MLHEKIEINVDGNSSQAYAYTYIQDYSDDLSIRKRPTVILCPGGGYAYTSDREAEPMAMSFLSMGCNAVVLRYSTTPAQFPTALMELAYTIKLVRSHAEEWHCDPEKIIVEGASAGGHLAASIGCFWNKSFLRKIGRPEEIRPNGLILCYPVITLGKYTHEATKNNIIGNLTDASAFVKEYIGEGVGDNGDGSADKMDMVSFLSLENHAGEVPPCFIWATFEDGSVPVQNSMMFAEALVEAGVSIELHIFPHGGHGYALADERTTSRALKEKDSQAAKWAELVNNWILREFPLSHCIG